MENITATEAKKLFYGFHVDAREIIKGSKWSDVVNIRLGNVKEMFGATGFTESKLLRSDFDDFKNNPKIPPSHGYLAKIKHFDGSTQAIRSHNTYFDHEYSNKFIHRSTIGIDGFGYSVYATINYLCPEEEGDEYWEDFDLEFESISDDDYLIFLDQTGSEHGFMHASYVTPDGDVMLSFATLKGALFLDFLTVRGGYDAGVAENVEYPSW